MEKETLQEAFHREMKQLPEILWHDIRYNATRFRQMLGEHGGYKTAQLLINPKSTLPDDVSEGFKRLWEEQRLDLSVEALVCKEKWAALFTEEEREFCRKKLLDCGYDPKGQKG